MMRSGVAMSATRTLLWNAEHGGYAVPAFNVFDELSMRAVLSAADKAKSPVIVQVSTRTARSTGAVWLAEMFRHAASEVSVPSALHLDHCPDLDVIQEVVEAGWSSVLFDASHLDFDEAVRQTSVVVRLAHTKGVAVESEIENIIGVEDGVGSDVLVHSYSPAKIVAAAEQTGVDFLAPQLGTAHGEYHGRPQLRPDRVAEFRSLGSHPVVLHGGTGLTASEFRSFIEAGVSKVNISTAVKLAYMKSAQAFLASQENDWEPGPFLQTIHDGVVEALAEFFEVFGSAGRA